MLYTLLNPLDLDQLWLGYGFRLASQSLLGAQIQPVDPPMSRRARILVFRPSLASADRPKQFGRYIEAISYRERQRTL